MSFNLSSFRSFCDGWLEKADQYQLNSLTDYFDKFFTIYVVFNRLYNEVGKILVKRNEPGLKLPRYKYAPLPDKASATDYIVRYYGEDVLKNEMQADRQCSVSVVQIVKLIEHGSFYFHENYETGRPNTAKDLELASKAKFFCPKSILSIIYAARCNMLHGSKEFSAVQQELLVDLIYILEFITKKIYEKIVSDLMLSDDV